MSDCITIRKRKTMLQLSLRFLPPPFVRSDCSAFMWHRIKSRRRPRTPSTSFCWSPTWGTEPPPRAGVTEMKRLGEERLTQLLGETGGKSKFTVDRLLSRLGLTSRTEAVRLIERGRIQVNGRMISQNQWVDVKSDCVSVNGHPLEAVLRQSLLMFKPRGVVVTRDDPEGRPTVLEYLPDPSLYLSPAGRLDLNSEGLLLLTNDTKLAHCVTTPEKKIEKKYVVVTRKGMVAKQLEALSEGVSLSDGPTLPCRVRQQPTEYAHLFDPADFKKSFLISLTEGKHRQVRRMCEAVGSPEVDRLVRVAIGPWDVRDFGLQEGGECVPLEEGDVTKMKHFIKPEGRS